MKICWGFFQDPTGGAYSAPRDLLSALWAFIVSSLGFHHWSFLCLVSRCYFGKIKRL